MALSPREKYIAIGVGAAVVLYALDAAVLTPYSDRLTAIEQETVDAETHLAAQSDLFKANRDLKVVWTAMTRGGLSPDWSVADSQLAQALLKWAGDAGVSVTSVKPDRSAVENGFQVISYHFTCNGSTPEVTKLLWDIETATIPVRLTDVQITPRKEGTDDLTIQFGVSTLVQPQPAADGDKPAAAVASDGGNAS